MDVALGNKEAKNAIDIYVGRQPIFGRKLDVIGYELLYRNSQINLAQIQDGDLATTQVILNTFTEFSLEGVVGPHQAFINLTRNFLLEKFTIPFSPKQVVLEVPEYVPIDEPLIRGLEILTEKGYKIALDDVVNPWKIVPLLGLVDIVKLDLLGMESASLPGSVHMLKKYDIKLLAEKIENQQTLDLCIRLGFDYFQGYFLSKPNIVSQKHITPSQVVILRLLSKIQNPDVKFGDLEIILAQDATLGYKLLRLINSSFFGISTRVSSIRQAMALLGVKQLQAWLTLFLLMGNANKPRELTVLAMGRAKMCELLAKAVALPSAETYFMVGLFSLLDAIMDLPLEQILSSLPLSMEIVEALLNYHGNLGEALRCTIAYENGDWDHVYFKNLAPIELREIYLEAIQWTSSVAVNLEI